MQSRCESPPTTHELFPGVKPSGGAGASGGRRIVRWVGVGYRYLYVGALVRSRSSLIGQVFLFSIQCAVHRASSQPMVQCPLDGPQRTSAEDISSVLESAAPRSGGRSGREAVGLLAVTPLLCYSPGADGPAEGPPVRPACCASASPEKRPVTTSSGSSRKRAYTREA